LSKAQDLYLENIPANCSVEGKDVHFDLPPKQKKNPTKEVLSIGRLKGGVNIQLPINFKRYLTELELSALCFNHQILPRIRAHESRCMASVNYNFPSCKEGES